MEFPAVGYRYLDSSGTLSYPGNEGDYWSSVALSSNDTYYLYFGSSDLRVDSGYVKRFGYSVRCVR